MNNKYLNKCTQDPSGWWMGELNGRRGMFPSNFCQPYSGGGHTSAPQVRYILGIPPHATRLHDTRTNVHAHAGRARGPLRGRRRGGRVRGDPIAARRGRPALRRRRPVQRAHGEAQAEVHAHRRPTLCPAADGRPNMCACRVVCVGVCVCVCVSCRVVRCAAQDASDTEGGNAGPHGGLAAARGCAQLSDVARRRRRRPCGLGLGARRLWRPARQCALRLTKRPRHTRRTTHCR
jgi:hypothetical protein